MHSITVCSCAAVSSHTRLCRVQDELSIVHCDNSKRVSCIQANCLSTSTVLSVRKAFIILCTELIFSIGVVQFMDLASLIITLSDLHIANIIRKLSLSFCSASVLIYINSVDHLLDCHCASFFGLWCSNVTVFFFFHYPSYIRSCFPFNMIWPCDIFMFYL